MELDLFWGLFMLMQRIFCSLDLFDDVNNALRYVFTCLIVMKFDRCTEYAVFCIFDILSVQAAVTCAWIFACNTSFTTLYPMTYYCLLKTLHRLSYRLWSTENIQWHLVPERSKWSAEGTQFGTLAYEIFDIGSYQKNKSCSVHVLSLG